VLQSERRLRLIHPRPRDPRARLSDRLLGPLDLEGRRRAQGEARLLGLELPRLGRLGAEGQVSHDSPGKALYGDKSTTFDFAIGPMLRYVFF
jgi:hypothetical protein